MELPQQRPCTTLEIVTDHLFATSQPCLRYERTIKYQGSPGHNELLAVVVYRVTFYHITVHH